MRRLLVVLAAALAALACVSQASAATKTVACGSAVPSFAAGDVVVFAGLCNHRLPVVRVTVPNVTFRGEPGAVLDGGRPTNWIQSGTQGEANAFYPQDAADGLVIEDLVFKNYRKSVIYARLVSNATYRDLQFFDSGSDGSPADPASGPQDHALYLDGGTGIVIENVFIRRMTGAGLHPYSGSGSVTTGTATGLDVAGVGFDGVHFGNASKDWLIQNCLLHENTGNGVRSYKGTGNRVRNCNIWANTGGNVRQDVPLAELSNIVFAAPTAEPPPPPPPPPPPAECDQACVDAYEAEIASLNAQLIQAVGEAAALSLELAAEEAISQALRDVLSQIHSLSAP